MQKRWRIVPHDAVAIARLADQCNVSHTVAQLLATRGICRPEAVASFLECSMAGLRDPETLPGMTGVADGVYKAIQDQRQIVIYGDYDADGMTSTSILLGCLKLLGAQVSYFVPNRMEDGYGLNSDSLAKLAERGKQTVISVDCGIASVTEAAKCAELGLQLFITDHHQIGESLPVCDGIAHPALPGFDYPFPGLCGAGVAFKLAWSLCQRASRDRSDGKVHPAMRQFLLQALGLAAIGTVADVVPLIDENRVIVRHGLRSLKMVPSIGVSKMLALTGLDKRNELASEDIGFTLGPRLNAAGRLGQAQLAVELLTTADEDRASALADYLNQLNGQRETLERSIYLSALKQIKEEYDVDSDPAFVLASSSWHVGVIGVVAGKLAEKFQRPVVLVSLDAVGAKPGTGSARSGGRINLYECLQSCREFLVTCGGHAAAAGLRVDESQLSGFRTAFCEMVTGLTCDDNFVPEIVIDAEVPLGQLSLAVVDQIDRLAPFGQANTRPILCSSRVRPVGAKTMGNDRHMTVTLEQQGITIRAVAFGQAEWVEPLTQTPGEIDVAFRPVINEFQGRRKVELHLIDWRPCHASVPMPHLPKPTADIVAE